MFPQTIILKFKTRWKLSRIFRKLSHVRYLTHERVWKLLKWHLLPLWSPWTAIIALDHLVWSLFLHVDMKKESFFFFFNQIPFEDLIKELSSGVCNTTLFWPQIPVTEKKSWLRDLKWSLFRYFYVVWKVELYEGSRTCGWVKLSASHTPHLTKKRD